MRVWRVSAIFAAGLIAGCMAGGPPLNGQPPPPAAGAGSSAAASVEALGEPLIIDRGDLRIGTTVQLHHIPTVSQLHDLTLLPGLAHVVLTLPEWPEDSAPLQPLYQLPEGADLIVVLNGYPPGRAAAEAWSTLNLPLRIVVVVSGPPATVNPIADLNAMPGLERVIAQMSQPSRSGFERLQRPLSFRTLMD
jgi:hypothetical protein